MRCRIFLLCVILFAAISSRAEDLDALGLDVTYKLPNEHWKLADKKQSTDKGMILFYNDAYPSHDLNLIDPSLSIIYERLPPDIKTSRQYAEYSQKKNSYPLAGQMEIGDRVLYFHRWQARFKNNLFRMFQVQNGIGVQSLGTVTAEKFNDFKPQILDFVSNVSIAEISLSENNTKFQPLASDIDNRFVGEWQGKRDDKTKCAFLAWKLSRHTDGKFEIAFYADSMNTKESSRESGIWWVKDNEYFMQTQGVTTTDGYSYTFLDKDTVQYKAIKRDPSTECEADYEFTDRRVVDKH